MMVLLMAYDIGLLSQNLTTNPMLTQKASPANRIRVWAIPEGSLLRPAMMVLLMASNIGLLSQPKLNLVVSKTLKPMQLALPRLMQLVSMAEGKWVWAILEASTCMPMHWHHQQMENGSQLFY